MSLKKNRKLIGYVRTGNYKLVRITDAGKFTTAVGKGRAKMTWREYQKALAWAKSKKMTGLRKIEKKDSKAWAYPFLSKRDNTRWPTDKKLLVKMNAAARDAKRRVLIISGYRTIEEQRVLYNLYLSGRGNLAAPPGRSNHNYGKAADCGTVNKYGTYKSAFHDAAFKYQCEKRNLRAWVPGEAWHLQRAETY